MTNFNQVVSNFVASQNSYPTRKSNYNARTSSFIDAMKQEDNFKHTENGAVAKKSTMSKLYDLFALGGSYRSRTESDCIVLFKAAYQEHAAYALKCLWYLRDILEGQGERRFFRVCLKWLATYDKQAVLRNLDTIARDGFGRWDDLFVLFDTPCEDAVMKLIENQLVSDLKAYQAGAAVSLLGKWIPSENSSSAKTKHNARRIIAALHVSPREYRKTLSALRERIHVVERLMSQNRWDEIDFSHLPSRAGLIYRKAFERRDMIQQKYREFAKDTSTKVNAGKLYPYDVVREAQKVMHCDAYWNYGSREPRLDDTQRLMVNKYWDNLRNVFPAGENFNAMVVCDTSSSMLSGASNTASPMQVAVSLAMYAAERANGPFKNHYISFSRQARLVEVLGVDFCDKVSRIIRSNVCENTNLESVFDLVLNTAMQYRLPRNAMPKTLVVVSDMEVDRSAGISNRKETFMESMRRKWAQKCGNRYEFPDVVFWNVSARNDTFLDDPKSGITYVSGCSPVLFEQIMSGKTSIDLMMDKLNAPRYKDIH